MSIEFDMALKFLVCKKGQTVNKNALTKSSPTMGTLVEEHSNYYGYFLRLSGFPDLSGKVYLITSKFS